MDISSQRSNLNLDQVGTDEEWEPECGLCGYRASHGAELETHIRRHTGEKPFKCHHAGCGYESADEDSLVRHFHTSQVKKSSMQPNKEPCSTSANLILPQVPQQRACTQNRQFKRTPCGVKYDASIVLMQPTIVLIPLERQITGTEAHGSPDKNGSDSVDVFTTAKDGHMETEDTQRTPNLAQQQNSKNPLRIKVQRTKGRKKFKRKGIARMFGRCALLYCRRGCARRFRTFQARYSHEETHTAVNGFPCTICPSDPNTIRFRRSAARRTHHRRVHECNTR